MASLCSQVVLHPSVTQAMALLATTMGRDKTYRLIQYTARILAWSLARHGAADLAARFVALKSALASGRKLMRVFKPIENLQSSLNIYERPLKGKASAEALAQIAQFARQLCYSVYLTADSTVWLQGAKVLNLDKDKMAKITRVSQKAWFFGIILSLVSSTSSLVNLRAQSRRFALQAEVSRREGKEKGADAAAADETERRQQGRALLAQRQTIMSQLVTDSFDIWLPATSLGYTNLNEGVIGLLGATTSYMALQKCWKKAGAAIAKA